MHYRDSRTDGVIERVRATVPDRELYDITGLQQSRSTRSTSTNASATGLYDVRTRTWATELAARLGISPRLLPPLRSPGDLIGTEPPEIAAERGLPEVPVVAVGSHDTASAVVGVPVEPGTHHAYLSSGTWSLVGVELDAPALSEEARKANFTNEAGVDGTIRFLRNVMGLWVLSETLRSWEAQGRPSRCRRCSTRPRPCPACTP